MKIFASATSALNCSRTLGFLSSSRRRYPTASTATPSLPEWMALHAFVSEDWLILRLQHDIYNVKLSFSFHILWNHTFCFRGGVGEHSLHGHWVNLRGSLRSHHFHETKEDLLFTEVKDFNRKGLKACVMPKRQATATARSRRNLLSINYIFKLKKD